MRPRRSRLYVGHEFSTATSPVARPPQAMRLSANSAARSWKLRTAPLSESLNRSKRANGDGGATGCGTGTGAAETAAAGGGAGGGDPAVGRRRGPAAGGGGGAGLRFVIRDTNCFPRSNNPGSKVGLRIARYQ